MSCLGCCFYNPQIPIHNLVSKRMVLCMVKACDCYEQGWDFRLEGENHAEQHTHIIENVKHGSLLTHSMLVAEALSVSVAIPDYSQVPLMRNKI